MSTNERFHGENKGRKLENLISKCGVVLFREESIIGYKQRQLDKKNRIRYMVNETTVIVFIISAWGHYDDK